MRRYEVEQQQLLGNWLVVSRHGQYDKANKALDELDTTRKARIVEVIEERNIVASTIKPTAYTRQRYLT